MGCQACVLVSFGVLSFIERFVTSQDKAIFTAYPRESSELRCTSNFLRVWCTMGWVQINKYTFRGCDGGVTNERGDTPFPLVVAHGRPVLLRPSNSVLYWLLLQILFPSHLLQTPVRRIALNPFPSAIIIFINKPANSWDTSAARMGSVYLAFMGWFKVRGTQTLHHSVYTNLFADMGMWNMGTEFMGDLNTWSPLTAFMSAQISVRLSLYYVPNGTTSPPSDR
ncbi:uncharacterized protein EV420DRAFT_1649285 [Desarmillaria tabescens]|uniref:Uncharacterized protein n=1 Tax=Armillaria tabescens TaxID=1929756 RepID=A0AA39JKC6_ARMTA|nr:uncharacterized protein EV420DRAFT_1649285 [Desarmillaria tabescens]KAK0443351.1 hypothetical protein EV420DRAFT_1649285 [Desarmillaria tabescens]